MAGHGGDISVISTVEARVVRLLKGGRAEVSQGMVALLPACVGEQRARGASHSLMDRTGHTTGVIELAGCPKRPGLLASLAKDGSVRVWDVPLAACLATYAASASALVSQSSLAAASGCTMLRSWDPSVDGDNACRLYTQRAHGCSLEARRALCTPGPCLRLAQCPPASPSRAR